MVTNPRSNRGRGWRAWRRSRGARRTAIAALLAAILGTVALIVLPKLASKPEQVGQSLDPWTSSELCDTAPTRETCSAITDGVDAWRYALLRSPNNTAETVLVDLGGPGQAVLSGAANLGAFAADFSTLSERYNLLFIEEPWVTQELPQGCETALVKHFRHLRDQVVAVGGSDSDVAQSCQLAWRPGLQPNQPVANRDWGFDPATYADLVAAISRINHLSLKGFVGHSWGSMRLAYLLNRAPEAEGISLNWSVLVRPFPVGVDGETLTSEQATILEREFGTVEAITPTTVKSRSLPVTLFDQLSAVVELGYSDERYVKDYSRSIVQGDTAAEIGTLSDEYWQRFGRDSLSPARLAEWQEVCSTTQAPVGANKKIRSVADLLAARFAACDHIPLHQGIEAATAGRTCIVTASNDSVTPQLLIRKTYQAASPETTWVESTERQHGSFDGLSACIEAVL